MERVLECACIKIYTNKTFLSPKQLDFEQAIVLRFEAWGEVELRGLDQAACIIILPAMVLAREQLRCATAFPHHSVCPMPADVVKCSKLEVLAKNDEELNAGKREGMIVARLCELALVAYK
jgi:hypothetical protein